MLTNWRGLRTKQLKTNIIDTTVKLTYEHVSKRWLFASAQVRPT